MVLDAETMPFVDVTAARMLADWRGPRRRGVRLLVARDIGQVRDVLAATSDQRVYPTVEAAVTQAR